MIGNITGGAIPECHGPRSCDGRFISRSVFDVEWVGAVNQFLFPQRENLGARFGKR